MYIKQVTVPVEGKNYTVAVFGKPSESDEVFELRARKQVESDLKRHLYECEEEYGYYQ